MNTIIKRIAIGVGTLTVVIGIGFGVFIYKVKYGFPIYDKKPPELNLKQEPFTILLYSKANGFVHKEGIEAAKKMIQTLAVENNWELIISDNGAVFNENYLPYFDVVIWNNVTGRTLDALQRAQFRRYMEKGGRFIGIHGTGDDSHHWPWFSENLIGAHFSHHSINPQIQRGTMTKESNATSPHFDILPDSWSQDEEWYVFFDNPRDLGAKVLYTVDESNLVTNGNIPLLVNDKNFGMDDHPVLWYRCFPEGGKAFYSALGHGKKTFENPIFKQLIKTVIVWAGTTSVPWD